MSIELAGIEPKTLEITALVSDGRLKARWHGSLLLERDGQFVLAARWSRRETHAGPLVFAPGDVLVEYFSTRHWFNIFAVWERGRRQRGWYVNLATPLDATRRGAAVHGRYTDLALDFVVVEDQVVELDAAAWQEAAAQLPEPRRRQAQASAARLRRRLLEAGPRSAWRFLEQRLLGVASTPLEKTLPVLAGQYGVPQVVAMTLDWPGEGVAHWRRLQEQGEREGEAIYALRLPGDRTLVHSKRDYPQGVLRLPGGGIARGESPAAAATREAREETGLSTTVQAWLAYAHFALRHDDATLIMPNFVFLLDPAEPPVRLEPSAEEGITALREVPWAELPRIAQALAELDGPWRSWGLYRAIPHLLAYRALGERD